jgi:hypothetical protein
MSRLKPDYNYRPMNRAGEPLQEIETDSITQKNNQNQEKAIQQLKEALVVFHNTLSDADLYRYKNNTLASFRTNLNVLDTLSFFNKFRDSFIASIELTFPDKIEEITEPIDILFKDIEILLAQNLKNGNIENRFLLVLASSILESLLSYENY